MEAEVLTPIVGCWVVKRGAEKLRRGVVRSVERIDGQAQLTVAWAGGAQTQEKVADLCNGFEAGWSVEDVPLSATRASFGRSQVLSTRRLAGRDQVLVQTEEDGRSHWVAYERLKRVKSVQQRYERAETGTDDHAERFRLRVLAHALESWNRLTGALDRLEIDPLPHQIQLVHRIITSGSANWLIADDVGLGKTIETGLLLAAMKRNGQARRVLIVCPAGLTRQWQDEMRYKFQQDFAIYGRGFWIENPRDWKLYDHVIVSIDLAKREDHLEWFRQSEGWDVVIFDEGHKLSRRGETGERTERYILAETLRRRSQSFVALTATPHQGDTEKFIALLQLIRPDLAAELRLLEARPEIVSELILRNRKADVTDVDGNFIFHGQTTHRVEVETSEAARRFRKALDDYLRRGYRAGENMGGAGGRAIGFVMTTYRKLASSSIAAIERALHRRLARLDEDGIGPGLSYPSSDRDPDLFEETLQEGGDDQDDLADAISGHSATRPFFDHEREMLMDLLSTTASVRRDDAKLVRFLGIIRESGLPETEKILIFTEYRATQDYLQAELERHFPSDRVVLINGSMSLDEKLESIQEFNNSARFLVSTEAGGEGINLHEACHVLVNYDLPWNPSRLVQRIGRLYRYGQKQRVVVFNMHLDDSFDNDLLGKMMGRLDNIARSMVTVSGEYGDRLYADVLGELLENLDMGEVFEAARNQQIERSEERIEEALRRAQSARNLQDEIFSHVAGYDPSALEGVIGFTMDHVATFVRQISPRLGIEVRATLHDGKVLELRLPDELRGEFPEFGQQLVVRVTHDRRMSQRLANVTPLDFESTFFRYLIDAAKSSSFDGYYGVLEVGDLSATTVSAFRLRWQDDQGDPNLEEVHIYFRTADGRVREDAALATHLLTSEVTAATPTTANDRVSRSVTYDSFAAKAEAGLASQCTRFVHPNASVPIGAADIEKFGQDKE